MDEFEKIKTFQNDKVFCYKLRKVTWLVKA